MSNDKPPRPQQIDDATREAAWDELIRLRIRGATQAKCAQLLGFHPNTIKNWMARPAFQLKMRRTRALIFEKSQELGDQVAKTIEVDIAKLIDKYSTEAIEKIHSLMNASSNERIQLKAAIDMADRGKRTSKVHKVQSAGSMMVFTPEGLAAAAKVALEMNENRAIGKVMAPVELDASMVTLLEDECPD